MAKKNRRKRQPKINKRIKALLPNKEPRIPPADLDRYQTEMPVWQIGRIDDGGRWGWRTIGKGRWEKEILPKLRNFETMTWAEIENASGGRKRGSNNHFINVNTIIKDAKERLSDLQMDDIDQLFSLRLAGKTRLYGKRIGRVFSDYVV